MKPDRHDMTCFLVGPLWPTALTAARRPRRAPRARSLHGLVLIEFVVVMVILGWLASGRPGLARAADLAQQGLGLPVGEVFVSADQLDPAESAAPLPRAVPPKIGGTDGGA